MDIQFNGLFFINTKVHAIKKILKAILWFLAGTTLAILALIIFLWIYSPVPLLLMARASRLKEVLHQLSRLPWEVSTSI